VRIEDDTAARERGLSRGGGPANAVEGTAFAAHGSVSPEQGGENENTARGGFDGIRR